MTIVRSTPAQQILVATDFSESAEAALGVAAQYARALHARLHLLHVSTAEDIDVTPLLEGAAGRVGPDVPLTLAASGGDPAEEILRYAAHQPIDLIVVGTHGRTGVSRFLLGSVAERVVHGARCPVLVAPAPRRRPVPAAAAAVPDHEEAEELAPLRSCLVCAKPARDLVCEPCRALIRGEALERKQRDERAGRP